MKNVIIDLNVACPVPKIVKNGEGSALLKRLDLLYDVVTAMVKDAGKPVTAKIRMGFERGSDTAVETAKAVEAAGAAAVTVHGRTREQYYEGSANWDVIARVKKSVSIPVIGNGDVTSGQAAVDMMDRTGCDGVMIARGALGYPWIFSRSSGHMGMGRGSAASNRRGTDSHAYGAFPIAGGQQRRACCRTGDQKTHRMVCKGDERRRGSQAQDQHHYRCGGDETSYTFETGISPCLFYI